MKTILLEIEDDTYQTILDFIKLLPENRCRIFGEEELSTDEQQHIKHCSAQIEQGDCAAMFI